MKLKNNVLKIVMIMVILMALIIPVASYADEMTVLTPGGGTTTTTPTPTVKTTPSPTATASPKVTTTPTAQTSLPQTGIEDYTGLIVVTIILGASAIFAYIKMRKYKNL